MADQKKLAVVLGASAAGGTGWTIAKHLASTGTEVVVSARSQEGISRLATEIGGRAIVADATVESDLASLAASAVGQSGSTIDQAILVAGEGIRGSIDDISEQELRRSFELNCYSSLYFIRHMARQMADGGSIVLLSSIAATSVWPGYVVYGAAKSAMHTVARYAAIEYATRQIRVNTVCPGPILTPAVADR